MAAWRSITLIALIMGVLLTACTSDTSNEASVPAHDEIQDSGQTITVIEQNSMNKINDNVGPASTEKYQIQTRLSDFQLISDTTGIAWGLTRNELRLYLTQDNGKVWKNISPSSSVQFQSNPHYGKNIFFIDSLTGWIVRNSLGSAETVVLRTVDGGANWKLASLPEQAKSSAIFFISKNVGWIITEDDQDMIEMHKSLYRTEDGGVNWEKIMDNSANAEMRGGSPNPAIGSLSGMVFTDAQHGYVTSTRLGEPQLHITTDGGVTWKENKSFFNKNKYQDCEHFTSSAPAFFGGGSKEGWISVGCTRSEQTKFNAYYTADFGGTWKFVSFPIGWQSGVNQQLSPTFLNSKEGWALQAGKVFHTTSQGVKWDELPESSVLKITMNKYPEIVKFQFYSSKVGWLLVQNNELKRSLLLQTQDGGIRWHVL
ncbi:WD40/YVTN/BNR-like repeat-containing protein [Paenibacillus sp. SN-8-1]|uniref:WD40/YVTN/BNR-like repeat-containing protein n=1 Tax=Paenibacillus sp. SN-8-1 TaxID=3435409 RepID=UPI003D9A8A02